MASTHNPQVVPDVGDVESNTHKWLNAARQNGRANNKAAGGLVMADLPDGLRDLLVEFDDGDGFIDTKELASTLRALQRSRSSARTYMRISCFGAIVGTVLLMAVLGLTFVAVKLATPTGIQNGSLVVAGTEDPVRVASADFEIEDGVMVQRDGDSLSTAQAMMTDTLSSELPDDYLQDLRYLELTSPSGSVLHLDVLARMRIMKKDSQHGSIVILVTPVGHLTLDGEDLSGDEAMSSVLEAAGFEATDGEEEDGEEEEGTGRRLAGRKVGRGRGNFGNTRRRSGNGGQGRRGRGGKNEDKEESQENKDRGEGRGNKGDDREDDNGREENDREREENRGDKDRGEDTDQDYKQRDENDREDKDRNDGRGNKGQQDERDNTNGNDGGNGGGNGRSHGERDVTNGQGKGE